MRLATSLLPFVAAAFAVAASTSAQKWTQEELQARSRLLNSLPDSVVQDMYERGLDTLELDLEPWMMRDDESPYASHNLVKRGEGYAEAPGIHNCKDGNFAMTYDDGPYKFQRELTDHYAEAGMHMTYFVNLNNFDCSWKSPYVENLQYARSKKMTIGSHTATHPHMLELTHDQIDKQIDLVNKFLWRAVGVLPNFIRMPYGETNDTLNNYIWQKHRMHVVQWSTDSGDADGKTPEQSIQIIKKAIDSNNEIVLNHETHDKSVRQVAPAVIDYLKQKGKKSVGMKHCLGMKKAYKARREPEARSGDWNCDNVPAPGEGG